ncbi:hypothetical protein BpHYR1_026721 [Brachionus plicatilis]|uniref:Uncharacterized protein n=1 Tax=Brachionus plicatilis TaxID=10195 RepID=A0A3M7PS88_BRAPC|nr:hypothetical protein BpHYR1_026721 [Brachionus plicatilis]
MVLKMYKLLQFTEHTCAKSFRITNIQENQQNQDRSWNKSITRSCDPTDTFALNFIKFFAKMGIQLWLDGLVANGFGTYYALEVVVFKGFSAPKVKNS